MTDPATPPVLPALLAAILASPEEDAPRLVYADWLDETGTDPLRAEFIRVQCDIAHVCEGNRRGRPEPDQGRLPALSARESELMWGVWEEGWADPLPREWIADAVIRRGFVEAVTCTAAQWVDNAAAVLKAQPVVKVAFSDVGLQVERKANGTAEQFLKVSMELARLVGSDEFRRQLRERMAATLAGDELGRRVLMPDGTEATVALPRCDCASRRGPAGGVCGNCGGAIPVGGELREQMLRRFAEPSVRYPNGRPFGPPVLPPAAFARPENPDP